MHLGIVLGLIQLGCLKQKPNISEIKTIAEEILAEKVLQASADSGLIIIMEVNSGKILADVSVVNKDSSIMKVTEQGNQASASYSEIGKGFNPCFSGYGSGSSSSSKVTFSMSSFQSLF